MKIPISEGAVRLPAPSLCLPLKAVVSASLTACVAASANADNFTVDLNDGGGNQGANDRVGINLNFLLDRNVPASAISEVNAKQVRFPMGEIADYVLFDKDDPNNPQISVDDPSIFFHDMTENRRFKNDLRFDDFISRCQSAGSSPIVVIGIDAVRYTGSSWKASRQQVINAAADWVRYANITKNYDVKRWEIGNETDLNNDIVGTWPASAYAAMVVDISRAMKAVDPSIQVGATGQTGDGWWDTVAPAIKGDVDFLITHQYSWMTSYGQWEGDRSNTFDYAVRTVRSAINRHGMPYNFYVTEVSGHTPGTSHWNNTWKTLHNFEVMGNTMSKHWMRGAHFWVTRWFNSNALSFDAAAFNSAYNILPMGMAVKAWGQFDQQKIQPVQSSGKVRMWATFKSDRKRLAVYLLNKDDENAIDATVTLKNYLGPNGNVLWRLSGPSPGSTDVTWERDGSVSVSEDAFTVRLEPLSVTAVYLR